MQDLPTYRLTALLHPQSSVAERTAVEDFVRSWVREHGGDVRALRVEDKTKLAYDIRHQQNTARLQAVFVVPPADVRGLVDRLKLEQRVLRARLWRGEMAAGRRLKDVPVKRPEPAGLPERKPVPTKEKVPLEKLEEKIEEILGEEVL